MENSHSRKWIILSVVTLVAFITNLDSTIVIIGLPKIMNGLDMNAVTGLLVITGYIIANTILLLPAGKWADMFGTKFIFIVGLILFTISTALCGIANSGSALIVYRLMQGAGAALAASTATPTIVKTFPNNQLGLAMGINATSWVIGAIIGPVLGGVLISHFGWRSIFFATIPFLIICLAGAFLILKDSDVHVKSKTDWLGILTFGLGLTAIMIILSEGQNWGWTSAPVIALLLAAILSGIVFVINELRAVNPIFDFGLLSFRKYTAGLGITLNYCIAYFSLPLLLSIYLQSALHLSPMTAGLLMIPLSAPQLIMGPLGGKLADHFGATRMIVTGLVFLVIGMFSLGYLGNELSVLSIVIPSIIVCLANSVAWPSIAKSVLSATPKEQVGAASGMFFTIINIGRALSQTAVILIIQFSIPSAIVSKVIVGIEDLHNLQISGDLVHSINFSFHFFVFFFLISLVLAVSLLFSEKKNSAVGSFQGND